ncbi:MAG: AAA family ATPase [Cyanobacteriota bacterium]|nr:AAA family ATPase [Cyanobacteriota bacterium]
MMKSDPEFESFLRDQADLNDLSRSEWQAFFLAIAGDDIAEIAEKLRANESAIRQRLSQVYKKFGVEGRGPVKLNKLQQLIRSRFREYGNRGEISQESAQPLPNLQRDRLDWGEAPDLPMFYGRTEELETLEDWVVDRKCRLVALLGLGGIGKTALARKLAGQVEGKFDRLIWRSLRNTPPPDEQLEDWLDFVCGSTLELAPDIPGKIAQLVDGLRAKRCLLVLDDFDAVLTGGSRLKPYSRGYEAYGMLLRQVAELEHQSCLLLISYEKPREVNLLERATSTVRSLPVEGLSLDAAKEILREAQLKEEDRWEDLITMSNRNPFQLKMVARYLQDVFLGNVTWFIQKGTWIFAESREHFDREFEKFSELEQKLLRYLATQPQPVSYQEVETHFKKELTSSKIIETLASLKNKFWLHISLQEDSSEPLYELPYLLKKYTLGYQNVVSSNSG